MATSPSSIDVGRSLVNRALPYEITGTMLWGIHVSVTGAAMIALCQRGIRSKPRAIQLLALAIIFILTTAQLAMAWRVNVLRIQYALGQVTLLASPEWRNLVRALSWLSRPGGLLFLIGDVIILWRAWCLWMYRKVYLVLPLVFIASSCILSITFWSIYYSDPNAAINPDPEGGDLMTILMAAVVCSFLGTLTLTGMIGYQAFRHRKAAMYAVRQASSPTWKILLYLTESGAILSLIQLISMILFLPPFEDIQTIIVIREILLRVYLYISVTYPAIVVLMVKYHQTFADLDRTPSSPSKTRKQRDDGIGEKANDTSIAFSSILVIEREDRTR